MAGLVDVTIMTASKVDDTGAKLSTDVHFEPSLDALSLRSDVISSIESHLVQVLNSVLAGLVDVTATTAFKVGDIEN